MDPKKLVYQNPCECNSVYTEETSQKLKQGI